MPLIYDTTKKIFIKQNCQRHSGNSTCRKDGSVEAFHTNNFVTPNKYNSPIFEFDTPSYYTLGGTLNYYMQDYWSIFTNINQPAIKFVFTANTENFGTGTTIIHKIYRIPYKDYTAYIDEITRKNVNEAKDYLNQTITEKVTDSIGKTTITTTTKETSSLNTSESLKSKSYPQTVPGFNTFGSQNYSNITNLLTNPIITITACTSGFSTNTYNLFLNEYQKNFGDFQYQLFEDYGQYFITTQFQIDREQTYGLSDFYQLGANNTLVPIEYKQYYKETTPVPEHVITGGTFSGITVHGNFFTYFLLPNKPKWESPYVQGNLTTFSPTFFWSHVDDGDGYILQVTYNFDDSTSFSGVVYSYPIEKNKSNLSANEMLGTGPNDWDITQKNIDIVRKYSIPLLHGRNFWYRVGNIKELVDIFGVKQKVVSFSDVESASTTSNSYNTYVYVQSDSPHTSEMSEFIYPEYLNDSLKQYTLSGTVVGSVVTGATMQLILPDENYITQSTDLFGNYIFPDLEPGTYELNTIYRGYQLDSRSVIISGNTTLPTFKINLTWGNNYDTWGKMANENYFL